MTDQLIKNIEELKELCYKKINNSELDIEEQLFAKSLLDRIEHEEKSIRHNSISK